MSFEGKARNYKFYIVVSCGTTDEVDREHDKEKLYQKNSCNLKFTTADSNFFYEWFQKDHYDTGIKEKHLRLINPTVDQFNQSLKKGIDFFNKHSDEDDFKGGNIFLIFSGHGTKGTGDLCLKDDKYSPKNLLSVISKNRKEHNRRARIDLILDSCYSGAFVINLIEEAWNNFNNLIFLCDIWCSSSFDEVSYESRKFKHGIYSYHMKSKQEVMDEIKGNLHLLRNYNDKLKTVKELTNGKQNPLEYINGNLYQREKPKNSIEVYDLKKITFENITKIIKKWKN